MMKKLSAILAALFIAVFTLPLFAFAAAEEEDKKFVLSESLNYIEYGDTTYYKVSTYSVNYFDPLEKIVYYDVFSYSEYDNDYYMTDNSVVMTNGYTDVIYLLDSYDNLQDVYYSTTEAKERVELHNNFAFEHYTLDNLAGDMTFLDNSFIFRLNTSIEQNGVMLLKLNVADLANVTKYEILGYDRTKTLAHIHGGIYLVNNKYYYINYDILDNSYFDSYGYFSYRSGTVAALPLDSALTSQLNEAIDNLKPYYPETEYNSSIMQIFDKETGLVVFIVFSVILGFILPLVPLILSLVFAQSKKCLNPKRWYVLTIFSATWMLISLCTTLIMTI